MNNEPVAWINKQDGNSVVDWDKDPYSQEHTPLYTHPVKELTQDEILDIWYAMEDDSNNWTRYVEFARAILRKAQEK
jgi:hypothetical protein